MHSDVCTVKHRTLVSAFVCLTDRLAKGRNIQSICNAVNKAACSMTPGADLDALQSWTWQFGLQVTGFMVKASSSSKFASCCLHHAFMVSCRSMSTTLTKSLHLISDASDP